MNWSHMAGKMWKNISHKKHKVHKEEKYTFRYLNFFVLFVLFVANLYRRTATALWKQFFQNIHKIK